MTVLDPAFGVDAMGKPDGHLLLSKIFDGDVTKYNAFVSKMQSLPAGDHSATLRGTMKNIYGSDALANAKTQEFFNQFTANITDSTGNELVKLGTLGNLSSVDAISSKMISWGYNGMVTDPSQIQGLLDGLRSGTYTLNTLPAGWTKETACNVLFCNTYGSELKSLMFDTVVNTPPPLSPLPPLPPIDATG